MTRTLLKIINFGEYPRERRRGQEAACPASARPIGIRGRGGIGPVERVKARWEARPWPGSSSNCSPGDHRHPELLGLGHLRRPGRPPDHHRVRLLRHACPATCRPGPARPPRPRPGCSPRACRSPRPTGPRASGAGRGRRRPARRPAPSRWSPAARSRSTTDRLTGEANQATTLAAMTGPTPSMAARVASSAARTPSMSPAGPGQGHRADLAEVADAEADQDPAERPGPRLVDGGQQVGRRQGGEPLEARERRRR